MKVLVIPDVHLKPWMFDSASDILLSKKAERAVCLMDILDDWDQERNLDLYARTYEKALAFAEEFPDTLWCLGNHDLSYLWGQLESGYSVFAQSLAKEKLVELILSLKERSQIAYIHRIDDVLFMHGGLSDRFVKLYTKASSYNDVDKVIKEINDLGLRQMWQDESPIWLRPQYGDIRMYKPRKLLQVVGHTPVKTLRRKGNVISCDVFSTTMDMLPIGTEEFLIIDTKTWAFEGIQGQHYSNL